MPGVTADALRDGLLADQEAAERLFGGSVTLDGHLILIADLADEAFARAFAESIGGDLGRAVTRRGDREFVDAPAPPPFEVRHRRLFVTGGAADEQIARQGHRGRADRRPRRRREGRLREPGAAPSTGSSSTAAAARTG